MNDVISDILMAVVTAIVPVLTAFLVGLIRKAGEATANKSGILFEQNCMVEITQAVADAVAMVSQTYVDSLKAAGKFDAAAQKEAAAKALGACISSLSEPTVRWITSVYGNLQKYLTTRIEAQVRGQKTGSADVFPPIELSF